MNIGADVMGVVPAYMYVGEITGIKLGSICKLVSAGRVCLQVHESRILCSCLRGLFWEDARLRLILENMLDKRL